MIRLGINGFGRIGRSLFRRVFSDPDIQIVAINDLMDCATIRHLLRYDSVHRIFEHDISCEGDILSVDGQETRIFSETDPARLPWGELDVDIVVESTGLFLSREQAGSHLKAGARKVIISAPSSSDDVKFIVLGVNDAILDPADTIVSNSSCTTNCAAPMIKVLDDHFQIERAFITTVHSYTRDQNLHDAPHHKDLRRARAAAESIIPTSTGAAKALRRIFPHLDNNIGGAGIRVPVPNGSLTDITCTLKRPTSRAEINKLFREASVTNLQGILEYTEDPIVSVDILGNTHSVIYDSGLSAVIGEANKLIKVVGWYDNEAGYAARLKDLVHRMMQDARFRSWGTGSI
jgi:glyceraldehyde 3-phosphate dehydrogenase